MYKSKEYKPYIACPCGQYWNIIWHMPEHCPLCGRERRMRGRLFLMRWKSDAKWWNPFSWLKGHWEIKQGNNIVKFSDKNVFPLYIKDYKPEIPDVEEIFS